MSALLAWAPRILRFLLETWNGRRAVLAWAPRILRFLVEMWHGRRKGEGGSPAAVPPAAPAVPAAHHYLSAKQMARVTECRDAYQKACDAAGLLPGTNPSATIPWQAMAALHFREAEFSVRSTIPGGPFQLDPGGSGAELLARIERDVRNICEQYGQPYASIETDFPTACLVAAHVLKLKVREQPWPDDDLESILADALWGYNGRSKYHTQNGEPDATKSSWQFSPYVNNDPKRGKVFRIRGTIPDATVEGGRRKIDRPDPRPGALTIYRELIERSAELA